MIQRHLASVVKQHLKNFPAVAIVGPRQVGKTTLAKTFSDIYFDLESEEEKLRLDLKWSDVLSSQKLIILDEAQNDPEIFPCLKLAIDQERNRNGRFLILGSVSPSLMKNVSEFLTGRIAVCELYPFSVGEMEEPSVDHLWLIGGYPDGGILGQKRYPTWQKNYLDLLAMRDLPTWGLPAKPQVTLRLFKMLAAMHGQFWNASQIGKSLGLSYHTMNTYIDYLEQAFLIRKIQPYFTNIKKRLIKSPKIYWRDSGLLHSLMNIPNHESLINQPWVGNSWEGWIIEQIIIFLNNSATDWDGPYFFRTITGHEIDCIIQINGYKWAIEIKLTANPGISDMEKLRKTAELIQADKVALISRTSKSIMNTNCFSVNIQDFFKIIS
ncbi:ATP-binding protein [bacterium]|nr:MAG: ATP-binding protein [bacterium]